MHLVLAGFLAGEIGVMHVLQPLGQDMDTTQAACSVQAIKPIGCVQERRRQQEHDQAKSEAPASQGDPWRRHRADSKAGRRIWRAAGHRAKIECHRIRAAAVHDVARVNDQALLSHGDREIAPAAERLADGGHALQQRLVFEQGTSAIGGVSN